MRRSLVIALLALLVAPAVAPSVATSPPFGVAEADGAACDGGTAGLILPVLDAEAGAFRCVGALAHGGEARVRVVGAPGTQVSASLMALDPRADLDLAVGDALASAGRGMPESRSAAIGAGGELLVRVTHFDGPTASFVLLLRGEREAVVIPSLSQPRAQNDCGLGRDARDASDPEPWGAACVGNVSSSDDDAFVLTLSVASILDLHFTGADVSLRVLDASGPLLWMGPQERADRAFPPGTYVFEVEGWRAQPTRYGLTTDVRPFLATPDCGLAGDARPMGPADRPQSLEDLAVLTDDMSCTGAVDAGDDYDLYLLRTDGAAALRVALERTSADGGGVAAGILPLGILGGGFFADALEGYPRELVLTDAVPEWLLYVVDVGEGRPGVGYRLSVERIPFPAADDCGSGQDLRAVAPHLTLAPDATCSARLAGGDLTDVVVTTPPTEPSLLVVEANATLGEALVHVLWQDRFVSASPEGSAARVHVEGDEGPMRLIAVADARFPTDYSFRYRFEDDPQDDCGSGHDAGIRAARIPMAAASCAGALTEGDLDGYLVQAQPGDVVEARLSPPGVEARILDAATGEALSSDVIAGSVVATARGPVHVDVTHGSTYTIATHVHDAAARADCGSLDDTSAAQPARVEGDFACEGAFLTYLDRIDALAMRLEEGDVLQLRVRGRGVLVSAEDPTGASSSRLGTDLSGEGVYLVPIHKTGDWTIRLSRPAGPRLDYAIEGRILPS